MGIRIAICQLGSSGSPKDNLKRAEGAILQNEADLYIFPELFLTSYDNCFFDPEDTQTAEKRLRLLCSEKDCAVTIGAPVQWYNGITDSLLFITPLETYRYDKLYLANFGIYNEKSRFEPGKSPAIVEWRGAKIGLEICYDVMFPEIHRFYATHGCDIVIVSAASAEPSKKFITSILPARSVENMMYTIYCNSIGPFKDTKFYGCSGIYSPFGDKVASMGEEDSILITYADETVVKNARTQRPHLKDLRNDILWIV